MTYDVISVGGGLAGSAVGHTLAKAGMKVLVLEREERFRDRVRGEGLLPWGVNEARDLGLYDILMSSCGHAVNHWASHAWRAKRNLPETTPRASHCMDFHHPTMQEAMLGAAEGAGAEVRRGVVVTGVEPGSTPTVSVRTESGTETISARLIVGADGRASKARAWAGFEMEYAPPRLMTAGLLVGDLEVDDDTVFGFRKAGAGEGTLLFPLGDGRVRVYFFYRAMNGERRKYSGPKRFDEFLGACVGVGLPVEWTEHAKPAGPLAEFDGADKWIGQPYRNGVALVGDAASCNDPTWGNGLSLCLRDVRTLCGELLASDDWVEAGHRYALQHEEYFGRIRRITTWLADLHYEVGPEADLVRERAYPLLKEDRSRSIDFIALGPDAPCDEFARQRLFGEDQDPGALRVEG